MSTFTTASQAWTAEHIPGARLRVFSAAEGGAHFPFFEHPAAFCATVTGFIAEHPAARRGPVGVGG